MDTTQQSNELRAFSLIRELIPLLSHRPRLLRHAARMAADLNPCRHSVDFTSIIWFGRRYDFSGSQAAAVRLLWQAFEHGTPSLRGDTLVAAASATGLLKNLFRDHPAWGTLIVPGVARGTYRIADPITP